MEFVKRHYRGTKFQCIGAVRTAGSCEDGQSALRECEESLPELMSNPSNLSFKVLLIPLSLCSSTESHHRLTSFTTTCHVEIFNELFVCRRRTSGVGGNACKPQGRSQANLVRTHQIHCSTQTTKHWRKVARAQGAYLAPHCVS